MFTRCRLAERFGFSHVEDEQDLAAAEGREGKNSEVAPAPA